MVTLISDESAKKTHVGVGMVILPYLTGTEFEDYERRLKELIDACGMSRIHFTDIFGRTRAAERAAGGGRERFLDEYPEIVSSLNPACLSSSRSREALVASFEKSHYTDEELFHSLFWNNVARVALALRPFSVVHIVREIENNFTPALCLREFDKLLGGISQVKELGERNISVCRHPTLFTKQCLLYSSLGDLVAYAGNVLQHKIDGNVPLKKIEKNLGEMLQLLRRVFKHHAGLGLIPQGTTV